MSIFRRLVYAFCLISALAACDLAPQPPLPTLAALPAVTSEPTATPSPLPPTRTPLPPTWTPLHSAPATPTARPASLSSAEAIRVAANIAKVESRRRVNFSLWLTPQTELVQRVTLRYSFPSNGATQERRLPLPPQTLGETLKSPISHSLSISQMPPHEDRIVYEWLIEGQNGALLRTEPQTFKITEAITEERRDDLPILPAQATFVSNFPDHALLSVRLTPESPIRQARVYYTQNTGLVLFSFPVRVPQKRAGESIE
ncbi:MAG: hypothetical protein ACK4P1_10620, partial [Aggregatilineales bacterium]